MTRLCTLLAAVLLAASPAVGQDKEAGKLEGTYTIVGGEHGGEKIPAERIEGAMLTITADKITATDKDKKEFFAATYTLDRTAKPYRIMMVATTPKAGEKAAGVIEVSGDTVKLCYNLPGGTPPTDFKTQDKQHCFVLKRVKEKKE
jgi:uncharacterized protein (TIGR03067 family)